MNYFFFYETRARCCTFLLTVDNAASRLQSDPSETVAPACHTRSLVLCMYI